MSRNAAAYELQKLIEELHRLGVQAERLAASSGNLVDPKWFRSVQGSMTMARGDLHQKGLLVTPVEEAAP